MEWLFSLTSVLREALYYNFMKQQLSGKMSYMMQLNDINQIYINVLKP